MGVRVHETRAKRRVPKIDHPCSTGNRQITSCISNLVAFYDDHTVLQEGVDLPSNIRAAFTAITSSAPRADTAKKKAATIQRVILMPSV